MPASDALVDKNRRYGRRDRSRSGPACRRSAGILRTGDAQPPYTQSSVPRTRRRSEVPARCALPPRLRRSISRAEPALGGTPNAREVASWRSSGSDDARQQASAGCRHTRRSERTPHLRLLFRTRDHGPPRRRSMILGHPSARAALFPTVVPPHRESDPKSDDLGDKGTPTDSWPACL